VFRVKYGSNFYIFLEETHSLKAEYSYCSDNLIKKDEMDKM
jgi:hypothetical protein